MATAYVYMFDDGGHSGAIGAERPDVVAGDMHQHADGRVRSLHIWGGC